MSNLHDPMLEQRISEGLHLVRHLFPKRVSASECAFQNTGNTNGNDGGKNLTIHLKYDKSKFEKPPNMNDFVESILFYSAYVEARKDMPFPEIKEIKPGLVSVKITRENPRILAMLDTNEKTMSFSYRIGDEQAKQMVSAFVKKLITGQYPFKTYLS